jgi:sigma-B regulation protein RsbU (phosphoserine phosphatase)
MAIQTVEPPPVDVHRLGAMEIWGGNASAREHVSVAGFEAWLYASPHGGQPRGGDLCVVSTCAMGQIVRFTLADLSGHGEEAGDIAVRLQGLMRKHMNMPNPTNFARALNKEFNRLAQSGESDGRFATAVITTYFAPTDHFIVCNAGHPRPLLYHAPARTGQGAGERAGQAGGAGGWELFDQNSPSVLAAASAKQTGISNLPLGVIDQINYPQFATHLEAGDIAISYTDAFIEAAAPDGRQLGEQGLLEIARRTDVSEPSKVGPAILDAVSRWRGGKDSDDDATLLVLYHTATNPPDGAWDRIKALGRLVGLVR